MQEQLLLQLRFFKRKILRSTKQRDLRQVVAEEWQQKVGVPANQEKLAKMLEVLGGKFSLSDRGRP